ncbi:MAG TPA: hypothetical protein V6D21_06890, partial [Candidatus Obscuribacterales bacterium]
MKLLLTGLLPIILWVEGFDVPIHSFSLGEIKPLAARIIPDFSLPKINPNQPSNIDLDQCNELPSGYGIPGFRP